MVGLVEDEYLHLPGAQLFLHDPTPDCARGADDDLLGDWQPLCEGGVMGSVGGYRTHRSYAGVFAHLPEDGLVLRIFFVLSEI